MTSGVTKMQVISLYRSLMKEARKLPHYNFRLYAVRRIRDAFKDNKALSDQRAIKKEFQFGKENLEIIKRQALIGNMYKTDKLVIENLR